ncbi:MAG: hypothetical protein Q8P98_14245, partial [Candidatus Rokubacteria bacterium]|nr:hypothetical protein [Candidatus Rokubacteria bacterium]
MDAETRAYLDQALGGFRDDLSREFGTLRQEFGTLRGEFGTLHGEFGTVRGEFEALRQEVRDTAAETRRHFDVVAEHLRHDIRGIAEGVIVLSERVDRLGTGLRTEMDERFAAT